MRRHVMAWTLAVALVPLVGAGTAMADDAPVAGQSIGQTALSGQSADADATSTQIKPTNTNISVRVLSPGDDGAVTQSNTSTADATAGNVNETTQLAGQLQAGGGGGTAVQEIGQEALNLQKADADAESTQIKPTNTNISVRVLSPGDTGDVTQSNDSSATADAGNENSTVQGALQLQAGGGGAPAPVAPNSSCSSSCEPPDHCSDPCHDDGGIGIQAIGQKAVNLQKADADAKSFQWGATNLNAPVSVGGHGGHDCGCRDAKVVPDGGGDVNQSNSSSADATAGNWNGTHQKAGQFMFGSGPIAIQAIGQLAISEQKADADAKSLQFKPVNLNLGGTGGDVDQSNDSAATSWAGNQNGTHQGALQVLGGFRHWLTR